MGFLESLLGKSGWTEAVEMYEAEGLAEHQKKITEASAARMKLVADTEETLRKLREAVAAEQQMLTRVTKKTVRMRREIAEIEAEGELLARKKALAELKKTLKDKKPGTVTPLIAALKPAPEGEEPMGFDDNAPQEH